jgi:hypothetical protein
MGIYPKLQLPGVRNMSKIFVRERRHVTKQTGRPRFAIVGVQGVDLKIFKTRVRRAELEKIATETGAELVYLPSGTGEHGHHHGDEEGGRRRHDCSRED